jgi:hypothetical protein
MTRTRQWNRVVRRVGVDPVDNALLRGLIDGDIAVLVLKGLLSGAAFEEHRKRAKTLYEHASTTYYANGRLTTIGPYLAKYLANVDDYFEESRKMNELTAEVSFTVADEVRAGLAEVFSLRRLSIAQEPDGRQYAGTVVRIHPDGVANPMHNDKIMRDAAEMDLVVARLLYQLSCVICLQECASGGEAKVYAKTWEPPDEQFKIPGGLGYEYGVVEGVVAHEFKPQAEDVYIINPTYYHEILRVGGDDRLTVGFFLGFADDALDSAIAWG